MVETGNPYRDNVSRLITWGHWFSFFNIILAMLFVMLRMFYIMMYVSNMPTARSAVWAGAFMVNVAILFVGYR